MDWWGRQAAECLSDSPIASWKSSWQQVFNSRTARNHVCGTAGLPNQFSWEQMGLGCWYGRSAGGRRNGPRKGVNLSGRSNNMLIADRKGCYVVAAVNVVGEYHGTVGEHHTEQLCWEYQWRTEVVSILDTVIVASLSFMDQDNSTSGVSIAYFSPRTNSGGHNAWSGSDFQECHPWDDIYNQFEMGELVVWGQWDSHPWGSEHQYCQTRKSMKYLPCVIWYLNIQSKTIMQWLTRLWCTELCNCWSVPSVQD